MPSAVSTVTGEEVQFLIAKLNRAAPLLPFASATDVPLQDLSSCGTGTGTGTVTLNQQHQQAPPKHITQLESITNHLQSANLLQPGTTFCEFGCGTAKLSDHISARLQGDSSHLLIDRNATFGHTRLRDRAMTGRLKQKNNVRRITMDIGDITDLKSICDDMSRDTATDAATDDGTCMHSSPVVVISKHLCGPASDLSIQCCATTRTPMAVATCCHYLCSWSQFSNTAFFETLGITERDFEVMTIVSQWASMNNNNDITRKKEATVNIKACSSEEPQSKDLATPSWLRLNILPVLEPLPSNLVDPQLMDSKEFERSFPRTKKAALGKQCKLFLDTARAYRLQELGYRVKLVRYTTMSMEDHLLIAIPNSSSDGD